MAVAVGSLAIPGSTGNFSVSGLSFQPVAVILFNQFGHLDPHSWTMGCATDDTEQWATWAGTATEISDYNARKHESRTDACAFHRNSVTDALQWLAEFVSLDSTGFTLNLTTRNVVGAGEGGNIFYMAIGGDHIPDAYAGTFAAGASTGTTAVTDPGFRPTALIAAWTGDTIWDAGIQGQMVIGTGVTDGTSSYSSFVYGVSGNAASGDALTVRHIHRTDAVACNYDSVNTFRMELDSFDASGFTVDVVDAWTGDILFGYLAINSDLAVAGSGVQPDSNGTQDFSTPGLKPEGVFFCWPGVDTPSTTGSTTPPLRPGVGAATLSQQRQSSGIFRASTAAGVFTSDGYQIPDESMGFWGTGNGVGGSDNLSQASADLTAIADGSFTLTWSNVADTNDRAFGWLALPGELSIKWIPQIYRLVMPT